MADLMLAKGTTSQTVQFFVQDTRQSDGSGLTGLVFNTAGLTAYYIREGAASAVQITLATMTVGTWATGGFVAVDGTNLPGIYELSIPDAALATGAKWVTIMIRGAANMAVAMKEIELTGFDLNVGQVMNSGTAQAGGANTITLAAAASATDNLYKGETLAITGGTGAGQARIVTAYVGATKVATIARAWATNPDNTSIYAVMGTVTPAVDDNLAVLVQSGTAANQINLSAGNLAGSVASVAGAVASVTGNVGGNVVGTVASVVGAVGSVTAGVTVTTNNDKTGYALTAGERTAVATAILATALAELGQAQPAATPTVAQALMLIYMAFRNQRVEDNNALIDYIYNAAGTVIAKSTVTDVAGVFTRSQMVSGP